MKLIIEYIRKYIIQRQKKKCIQGKHKWLKNRISYDKYGRTVKDRYELERFPSWFVTEYYRQCSCCGYTKITRTVISDD